MIYLVLFGLLVLISLVLTNLLLIQQTKAIGTYMLKLQQIQIEADQHTLAVDEHTLATATSIASFMEYVAAFQGEDMIFNKDLRERASSHLCELAETLRSELV